MITTDLTSAANPFARNVLGLAGQYMKVPYFKPGYWRYEGAPVERRLAEVRRELASLVQLGRAYGIACGWRAEQAGADSHLTIPGGELPRQVAVQVI